MRESMIPDLLHHGEMFCFRCLYDVSKNCGGSGGKARRAVRSDVVTNLLKSNQPVYNFLQISSEIFGDDAM